MKVMHIEGNGEYYAHMSKAAQEAYNHLLTKRSVTVKVTQNKKVYDCNGPSWSHSVENVSHTETLFFEKENEDDSELQRLLSWGHWYEEAVKKGEIPESKESRFYGGSFDVEVV